jgi:hypothetical protein
MMKRHWLTLRKFLTGVFGVLGLMVVNPKLTVAQALLPIIESTAVNYVNNTLTVTGTGFGASPRVTLGTTVLTTRNYSATSIAAAFPSGSPPSSFTPGDYLLTITFNLPTIPTAGA